MIQKLNVITIIKNKPFINLNQLSYIKLWFYKKLLKLITKNSVNIHLKFYLLTIINHKLSLQMVMQKSVFGIIMDTL